MRVRVSECIHDIEPAEWDSLLGPDDIQMSHRFVAACQDAQVERARFRHLRFHHGGRLVGIAALSCFPVALDLLTTGVVRRLTRAARRLDPAWLRMPVLFCGLPVSFGQPCLALAPDVSPGLVLPELAGAMDEIAGEFGADLLCLKEFDPAAARRLAPLGEAGFLRVPSLPSCRLTVRWRSFDAYLASLRSGYRRQIQSSLRRQQATGLAFRLVDDSSDRVPALFALYAQVMERAAFRLEMLNAEFLAALNSRFDSRCRALLLERDGQLVTGAILLYTPATVVFLLVGIDYPENEAHQTYIHLLREVVPRYLFLRYRRAFGDRLLRGASRLLFPPLIVPPPPGLSRMTVAADGWAARVVPLVALVPLAWLVVAGPPALFRLVAGLGFAAAAWELAALLPGPPTGRGRVARVLGAFVPAFVPCGVALAALLLLFGSGDASGRAWVAGLLAVSWGSDIAAL